MPYVSWFLKELPYAGFFVSSFDSKLCGILMNFPLKIFADYMFSNEHINFLITYKFDFRNEELLSYYISFLRYFFCHLSCLVATVYLFMLLAFFFVCARVRACSSCVCVYVNLWLWFSNGMFLGPWRAISGKLNKNTISLLVKTQNVSLSVFCLFLLYCWIQLFFFFMN